MYTANILSVIYVIFTFSFKLVKCHKCAIFVQNIFNVEGSIVNKVFVTSASISDLNFVVAENSFYSQLFRVFCVYFDVPLVEFVHLVFTRMPGGVTVDKSGLCRCVPCLLSSFNDYVVSQHSSVKFPRFTQCCVPVQAFPHSCIHAPNSDSCTPTSGITQRLIGRVNGRWQRPAQQFSPVSPTTTPGARRWRSHSSRPAQHRGHSR